MERYFSSRQVCEILGIKELGTLYDFIRTGKLKAHKLGGNSKSRRHWRIAESDLEAFVQGKGTELTHTEASKK